jgi:hypothetical protein
MAVSVKAIKLWRREIDNRPGSLAGTLAPLAKAGADLQVVMGYRFPGNAARAAVEMYPVTGKKATSAAASGGLSTSAIPALLVQGDNRAGAGHAITEALGSAGINLDFLLAQVIGRRYSLVLGFDSEADAKKATTIIKRVAGRKKGR